MFKTTLKIIGSMLLAGYLLVAGFIYAVHRPTARYRDFRIEFIDTAETSFLRESDIRLMMKQAGFSPKGKEIGAFDTHALSQHLERNKLIRQARCYHTPDSILRIDIYQRHPIMRVQTERGYNYYIDHDGELMPVHDNAPALKLPLATGNIQEQWARTRLYEFALFLQKNHFWRSNIVQIHVTSQGEVELIPRVGDHVVKLGSFDNYEKKLDNLLTFYKKVLNKKGWNAYRSISLKFDGQVIGEKNE